MAKPVQEIAIMSQMAATSTMGGLVHGNAGKTPNHTLTYDDILRVVAFIRNYTEVHDISLPRRIPGMKSDENKKFLPCSTSKRQLYLEYAESCEGLHVKACAETTFNMLWRRYLPYIEKMKPMSDFCATCYEISGLIIRSANMQSDERITEAMH
uniref:Uncharacterized protein n=1 Tax=Amphimedon queenslandica TaxID=400682 RepID=A0A1X7U4Q7_AMPQE